MVVYLAQDVAWMLVLGVMQCLHVRLWHDQLRADQVATGLLFGVVCVLGMTEPYLPLPGIAVDGGSVVMGILGLFGGVLPSALALVVVGGYHVWLGSPHIGLVMAVLLCSVGLGLLYRVAVARGRVRTDVPSLLVFGLLLQLCRVGFLALSPIELHALLSISTALILVFAPATLLLALVLQEGQRRDALDMALRESESRFRTLIKDIPGVSVQAYAPDGTTRYWNKASERLYGFTAEEAIGRNLRDLIIPSAMREGVRQAMEHMFATREAIPAGELSIPVVVTDGDSPPQSTILALKVEVRDDEASFTRLDIIFRNGDNKRAFLYDASRNRKTELREGEAFAVADLNGTVRQIGRKYIVVALGQTDLRIDVGETIREAQARSAELSAKKYE